MHFRAEINPFLNVNSLVYPAVRSGCDVLDAGDLTPGIRSALDRDLSLECGNPHLGPLTVGDIDQYALAVARRLTIQWPEYDFDYASTRRWIESTFDGLRRSHGWTRIEVRDPQRFWCVFLGHARTVFPGISPYYYDLDQRLVADHFPGLPVPEGPPSRYLIEEPPFIIPLPLRHPAQHEISRKPLVIKTPSNVHRLEFFASLFPNATPWILHLTRNPARSINGLMDGWCHRGFFSYYMPEHLRIDGYSDRFPKWGRDWWNFDLPPGWQDYAARPLVDVCAFQWYSAHRATLERRKMNPRMSYLRIKSEAVLSESEQTRLETAQRIALWLGKGSGGSLAGAMTSRIEPVMATRSPQRDRWLERAELIRSAVAEAKISEMGQELGYSPAEWGN